MSDVKFDMVWRDYAYDCNNPKCLSHGIYSRGDPINVRHIPVQAMQCVKCGRHVALKYTGREYRVVAHTSVTYELLPLGGADD